MKIKSLHIKNFKSIVDLTINEPNPFTVFVGPNGSGKSNIFEALEFATLYFSINNIEIVSWFGGFENVKNFGSDTDLFLHINSFGEDFLNVISKNNEISSAFPVSVSTLKSSDKDLIGFLKSKNPFYKQLSSYSRIFVGNKKYQKINFQGNDKLSLSCDNLEKVLKRLLENPEKREEISEWLDLFLPEFDRIEVQKSEFSSNENLLIYQKHYERPFNKELLSDGTYNIIALLVAVYQSDEPQFLCIEEPENGLHPKVIKQLVNFFRDACEEKGHYIWLNTHSQTLVSVLEPKEIILVDKKNGETKIKQFDKNLNLHGFEMDEAWLSNALGGGLPW